MKQKELILENEIKIRNSINRSLINSICIFPSSISILSPFCTQSFSQSLDIYSSILSIMNPKSLNQDDEINKIFKEDDLDQLKNQIMINSLNPNFKDCNGISLIEKCVLFNSKKCMNFLLNENASISKHTITIDNNKYEIGFMEYGAMKGNQDVINICIQKEQKIEKLTLILGLISHHNDLVEWMIEEGKQKKYFDETIEIQILGLTDNIEFNEKQIQKGMNINAKDKEK